MTSHSNMSPEYVVLPFRWKRMGDRFLVTTESGAWNVLDKQQFELLKSHGVERDPNLFSSLLSGGLIATRKTFGNVKDRIQKRLWHITNGTSLHVVALTNDCNFACKYCYAAAKDRQDMSAETAKKVADFIMQSPAKTMVVEFSGGEPLLNFDALKVVVEESKRLALERGKRVKFAMVHNGSKWDKEKMKYFTENHIGVCFSLDGPEDLHNLHRPYSGGGGTYKDAVRWIKAFRKKNYKGLNAIPVITRHSLPRWKELADEYLSLGFRILRFKYIGYFGRAPSMWGEIGYTPEEFLESWKALMEYLFELNKRGVFMVEGMARILAQKLLTPVDPGFAEMQMPCGAGIGQMAYAPDGSVFSCDEGRMIEEFKIGSVEQTHSQVMKNSVLKGIAMASCGFLNKCDACVYKPFCGVCPVESYNMTGGLDVKIPFDRRCKIHMGMLDYLFERSTSDIKFRDMLVSWARSSKREVIFGSDD